MQFSIFSKTLALLLFFVGLTGCSSDPKKSGESTSSSSDVLTNAVASGGIDDQGVDSSGMPEAMVIYFDFDRSEIKSMTRDLVEMHAKYLSSNSGSHVILEGHCDERGTVEYNLALGERRANSVRRVLIANGVNPDQIETVSFGEERPAMIHGQESPWHGHKEEIWSKNRRVEFKYQN